MTKFRLVGFVGIGLLLGSLAACADTKAGVQSLGDEISNWFKTATVKVEGDPKRQ
ncbi:MAG: hypothetical protein AB7G15_13160 [Alphaproteobacteria bacterium]